METMKITENVPIERVHDMLVSAFEGGSNYWYMIVDEVVPEKHTFTVKTWDYKREKEPSYLHLEEIPFNEGGALLINDEKADEPKLQEPVRIDLETMEKGLQIMARDYKAHYADFLKENDDAETADVFLQCVVFGDVIYG